MSSLLSPLYDFLASFPRTRVLLAREELKVTGQAAALWRPRERAGPPPPVGWRFAESSSLPCLSRVNARIL